MRKIVHWMKEQDIKSTKKSAKAELKGFLNTSLHPYPVVTLAKLLPEIFHDIRVHP